MRNNTINPNNQNRPNNNIKRNLKNKKTGRRITETEQRRKKKIKKIVSFLFLLIFIISGIIFSISYFFKINEIIVVGDSIYTNDEIIYETGIITTENIFKYNTKNIEKSLLDNLIYLNTVDIEKQLPNKIVITITPSIETYALKNDDEYLILSKDLKVLNKSSTKPGSLCEIIGYIPQTSQLGDTITTDNTEKDALLQQLLLQLEKSNLMPINQMDIMDDLKLSVISNNLYKIKLGSIVEIEYKIKLLEKIILTELDNNTQYVLDASSSPNTKAIIVNRTTF